MPLDFYERFREPLRKRQSQTQTTGGDGQQDTSSEFNRQEAVLAYQKLIKELPPLNRQLLLYILDLLTVFASKSDLNRMTAANLAAIFQPGLISHPNHDMSPQEYRLSQDVLIFLIENQDNFLFGMTGTAADEQTVKEMQEGIYAHAPKSNIRRSASNASAGADSLRKFETMRRNVSVSSKNSGGNITNPSTPKSKTSFGVHRSNTVPSKRGTGPSPATFKRQPQQLPPQNALSPSAGQPPTSRSSSRTPSVNATKNTKKGSRQEMRIDISPPAVKQDELQAQMSTDASKTVLTPTRERKLGSLFGWSSPSDDGRLPNRLKKRTRRLPGSTSESAESSTQSLPHHADDLGSPPPPLLRGLSETDINQSDVSTPRALPATSMANALNTPAPQGDSGDKPGPVATSETTPKSAISRTPSPSLNYITDQSDLEHAEESSQTDKKDKRRSWRFRSSRRVGEAASLSMSPPAPLGSHTGASFSNSSLASSTLPNQSISNEATQGNKGSSTSTLPSQGSEGGSASRVTSPHNARDNGDEERRGFFSKFKAKVSGSRDRESDPARAQSPPSFEHDKASSRSSLSFFKDGRASRGPSVDIMRDQSAGGQDKPNASTTSVSPPANLPSGVLHSNSPITTAPAISDVPTTTADVVTVLPKVEEEPSPAETVVDKPENKCEVVGSSAQAPNTSPTQVVAETQSTSEVPPLTLTAPVAQALNETSRKPAEEEIKAKPGDTPTGVLAEAVPSQADHSGLTKRNIQTSAEAPTIVAAKEHPTYSNVTNGVTTSVQSGTFTELIPEGQPQMPSEAPPAQKQIEPEVQGAPIKENEVAALETTAEDTPVSGSEIQTHDMPKSETEPQQPPSNTST